MTPVTLPRTRPQERYNTSLCKTRVTVEMAFGILKRRFASLNGLRVTPEHAGKCIVTAVVLHNIACRIRDYYGPIPVVNPFNPNADNPPIQHGIATGQAVRDRIIQEYFT